MAMFRPRNLLALALLALLVVSGCEKKKVNTESYYMVIYMVNEPGTVYTAPTVTYINAEGGETEHTPSPWNGFWETAAIWIPRLTTARVTAVKSHANTNRLTVNVLIAGAVRATGYTEEPNGTAIAEFYLP
jgi:hypothetical protein